MSPITQVFFFRFSCFEYNDPFGLNRKILQSLTKGKEKPCVPIKHTFLSKYGYIYWFWSLKDFWLAKREIYKILRLKNFKGLFENVHKTNKLCIFYQLVRILYLLVIYDILKIVSKEMNANWSHFVHNKWFVWYSLPWYYFEDLCN